jgi:tetrapyrrole methylase family protein/MazG family protein
VGVGITDPARGALEGLSLTSLVARTRRHPAIDCREGGPPAVDVEGLLEGSSFASGCHHLASLLEAAALQGPVAYITPGDTGDDPHAIWVTGYLSERGFQIVQHRSHSIISTVLGLMSFPDGFKVAYPWSQGLAPSPEGLIVLGAYGTVGLKRAIDKIRYGTGGASLVHDWKTPKVLRLPADAGVLPPHPIALLVPEGLHSPKGALEPLVGVVARLREAGGCPWDREQTHHSLRSYAVEEAYEVVEAVDAGDMNKLCEELGDLLLQVVLHARIAQESEAFDIDDVVRGVCEKMVRRHPHVFADATAKTSADVIWNWQDIKRKEKGEPDHESMLSDLPRSWPALLMAQKVQRTVAEIGFDWDRIGDVMEKAKEEIRELEEARGLSQEKVEGEMGDVLFSMVNLSRFLGVNPEMALARAVRRFCSRFRCMETLAAKTGADLRGMSLSEMDRLWEECKTEEAP